MIIRVKTYLKMPPCEQIFFFIFQHIYKLRFSFLFTNKTRAENILYDKMINA